MTAFMSPVVLGVIPEHALLSLEHNGPWLFFRSVMSLLAVISACAWWTVLRYRRSADMGFTRVTAGFAVAAISLALATVPWRIVQESTFEQATYGSARCFVLAERSSQLQLFCPDSPEKTLVVSPADNRLTRLGTRQNVFSALVGAQRTSGGS